MTAPLFLVPVPFRGSRQYLHSTSIFDFLVAKTGADRNLSLTFRKVLTRPLAAFPADKTLPAQFRADGVALSIGEVDGPEPGREPYDEDAVVAACRIEGATITSDSTSATAIERVVAMNKRLLQETTQPAGKLMFGSVKLTRLPRGDEPVSVRLRTRTKAFYLSGIYDADDQPLGELVFTAMS